MCKKIFVVLFAFLAVFAVCWCFVFDFAVSAADSEISVTLTANRNIGSMTNISFDDTSMSQFNSWYSPMISAWGSPAGFLNFDIMSNASFSWEFTFAPSAVYTYVIFPRYEVRYGLGNTNKTVVYTNATPAIGAGDFELVDSRTLENISDGSVTVDYTWDLYRARYTGTASSFLMTCSGPGLDTFDVSGTWSFPIFAPKAEIVGEFEKINPHCHDDNAECDGRKSFHQFHNGHPFPRRSQRLFNAGTAMRLTALCAAAELDLAMSGVFGSYGSTT